VRDDVKGVLGQEPEEEQEQTTEEKQVKNQKKNKNQNKNQRALNIFMKNIKLNNKPKKYNFTMKNTLFKQYAIYIKI